MSTHNICFCGEIRKKLSGYPSNLVLWNDYCMLLTATVLNFVVLPAIYSLLFL